MPAVPLIDKIAQTVRFEFDPEDAIINPFVVNRLRQEFGIRIEDTGLVFEEVLAQLTTAGIQHFDPEVYMIGNFHHHRFEVIKELEELLDGSIAPHLAVLLGDESNVTQSDLAYSNQLLFPADPDQLDVYAAFRSENLVVQGPPGTGKSQVLANLLSKLIHAQNSALVISEKRVALEIIQRKLGTFGLDELCFVTTSETSSKEVISALKVAWIHYEQFKEVPKQNLLLSEQYFHKLQLQLDLLNDSSLYGGVGYSTFIKLVDGRDLSSVEYLSELPETAIWLQHKTEVTKLFDLGINHFVGMTVPGIFRSDTFGRLDRSLRDWIKQLDDLNSLFQLNTWGDLQKAMKKAALCQHFSSAEFTRFERILTPDSKEQKQFLKLYRKYLKEKSIFGTLEMERNNWMIPPSESETETLLSLLKEKTLIGKWRFAKQWKKVSRIAAIKAENVLHQWRAYLHQKAIIAQIEIDFCDFGITHLPAEVEMLHLQISAYRSEEYEEWQLIKPVERARLAGANSVLGKLHSDLKMHFRLKEENQLHSFLVGYLERIELLTEKCALIRELPDTIIRNLEKFASATEMELAVCKHNLVQLSSRFPGLNSFRPEQLLDLIHTIVHDQELEATHFAQSIKHAIASRFVYYHELLRTPSAKLTQEEKELKATLKKGKAILVREFAKTRSHPSLRELYASEAAIWLRLLKPVWLSNPSQVARCFPMQEGLFDAVIFDEASQIPLQNALGSIQRSNRVLVTGDSQQMGPASYFKSGPSEVVDVLHQSSFYWKNLQLSHHYRSEHPGLIAFSNRHFYNDGLVTYPSVKQEEKAIEWHYCEKGLYSDRVNEVEATTVANFIELVLDRKEVPGIVAFSEAQLNAIYTKLNSASKLKLEERIENGTLFFKALEHVQGEECDHLIISLGYGKDPEGNFHMRFGPLNARNGSKRLNVLLTRARKKIDFFSSVTGDDFQISSNEAVDLLRKFLQELKAGFATSNTGFPFGLYPKVQVDKLVFHDIHEHLKNAQELVTLIRVLESRGWKIEFQ